MPTVGIVSAGAMGSAVGAAYRITGRRVVTTLAGRSERTGVLAEAAGLELLPDLDAVLAESELVLSIAPPDRALAIATELAGAAQRSGGRPPVSDWNGHRGARAPFSLTCASVIGLARTRDAARSARAHAVDIVLPETA